MMQPTHAQSAAKEKASVFDQGYAAFTADVDERGNPFRENPRHDWWLDGWEDAESEAALEDQARYYKHEGEE